MYQPYKGIQYAHIQQWNKMCNIFGMVATRMSSWVFGQSRMTPGAIEGASSG